ncbi:MAG: HDOD domain-containing protein [Geothrix sp.]|uniref:HDOD domain-containing protein n=1 Tax=Geothrix sp. TaxID=1962974 RepID=UPI00185B58C1|nr:HDOD domain-containing protein [Geothrix sp.]NWJ41693.1 HDOD domain-containing protein [Geothrix sp.]WIL20326.1 MAG: HDOD domain-containing protein [Geothrix sp.]
MPMSPHEVIQNLGELPPLPQVATRVIRISSDSDTSTEQLQNLIRTDQALTSQILKVANSAMFGRMREVTTLTQAILTLGFSTTRSVVLASSVKNLFTRGPVGLQERILWEHALVTALTGSAFSRAMRFPIAEEVFLAGLMHDIGKSVMILKFPESYGTLLRRLQEEGGDGLSLELDTFGFDHAMVGEALLASWNLAEGIEAVARWHHDPLHAAMEHQRLVALVALGNQMAFDLQVGIGMPDALAGATWEAMDILHLNDAAYQEHRTSALEALERDKALITDL